MNPRELEAESSNNIYQYDSVRPNMLHHQNSHGDRHHRVSMISEGSISYMDGGGDMSESHRHSMDDWGEPAGHLGLDAQSESLHHHDHHDQHQHHSQEYHQQGSSKRGMEYGASEADTSPNSPPRSKQKKSSGQPPAAQPTDDRDDHAGGGGPGGGTRRAAQACLRCRRQKLRCTGGWPCARCTKAKQDCDFGKSPQGGSAYPAASAASGSGASGQGQRDGGSEAANARLEQLESSVANLLAGLAGNNSQVGDLIHSFDSSTGRRRSDSTSHMNVSRLSSGSLPPFHQQTIPPSATWPSQQLPPPTHVRPMDPPRIPGQGTSTSDEVNHVRFMNSPTVNIFSQGLTSPSNYTSTSGISPADGSLAGSRDTERKEKKTGKGEKPEERLAAAEDQGPFDAPFKPLVYHPSEWDNKEQSRRSSPQPSGATSRDDSYPPTGNLYDRRFGREKDDPINAGLVDLNMAETLFTFFIDHCHPFLPIVNVSLDDAFTTIRKSAPLFSAIIAVAARFYIKYTTRIGSGPSYPALDPSIPHRLANLAETHLAHTLLRKQHALSDVQAILLLAAWGLQSKGRGPEAWIVTGHAARVARRLEVHKVLSVAAETARHATPGSEEWSKLETFMPQWRTWLCWFCFDGFLSLGFGRPQSTQFETVDEQGFLQIRLNQPIPRPGSTASMSLYGDVYIAGQVQLTQIGRDLINWGEVLSNPEKAMLVDPRRAGTYGDRELSLKTMFGDLNARLDEWSRLWVWAGSPYTLYLGSSAKIARLQAEHMRLCLNSFALKSEPDKDEMIAQCLKKALNAAMSTIQTHYESSQTDLALSFATDYLTITLSQAAVFLIRITKAAEPVQAVVKLDPSVVAHYLKMSVDLLESADMSETRLSIYLAKTIREISKAGGIIIPGLTPIPLYDDLSAPSSRPGSRNGLHSKNGALVGNDHNIQQFGQLSSDGGGNGQLGHGTAGSTNIQNDGLISATNIHGGGGIQSVPAPFDWENFLSVENHLDLGNLLGLPGDDQPMIPGGIGLNNFGNPNMVFELGNSNSEFEFAWGGMGYIGANNAFAGNGAGVGGFGNSGNGSNGANPSAL